MGSVHSTVVNDTHKRLCVLTFSAADGGLRRVGGRYSVDPDSSVRVQASGLSAMQVSIVTGARAEERALSHLLWRVGSGCELRVSLLGGEVSVTAAGGAAVQVQDGGELRGVDERTFCAAAAALSYVAAPTRRRSAEAVNLLLIGDSDVGKSWLLARLAGLGKPLQLDPGAKVSGNDYRELRRPVARGAETMLRIWDASGEERFRAITNTYYPGSHGVLIVFDLTSQRSFQSVKYWLSQTQMHADTSVVKLLVGNKADCRSSRAVASESASALAREYHMPFIETSASDGTNVGRAFDTVAAQVLSGMGSRAPVKPLRRSSNSQDFDHSFKVVLLGDEGVGKSCLRWRYARDEFSSDSPATTSVEFDSKSLVLDGFMIRSQIWDIGGWPVKKPSSYYRGAHGAVVVYDSTRPASFSNIGKWITELRDFADASVVVLVVGNKRDCAPRAVSPDIAREYAAANNALFAETSAREGSVDEAFRMLFSEILRGRKDSDPSIPTTASTSGRTARNEPFAPFRCVCGGMVHDALAPTPFRDEGILRTDSV